MESSTLSSGKQAEIGGYKQNFVTFVIVYRKQQTNMRNEKWWVGTERAETQLESERVQLEFTWQFCLLFAEDKLL